MLSSSAFQQSCLSSVGFVELLEKKEWLSGYIFINGIRRAFHNWYLPVLLYLNVSVVRTSE